MSGVRGIRAKNWREGLWYFGLSMAPDCGVRAKHLSMDAVLWCLAGGEVPTLPPLLLFKDCYRDKDFVTSLKVEVNTITRHQRRENGRRIDNFAIKNEELKKKIPPPCVDARN